MAKHASLKSLVDLTKSTQALLLHFQNSLRPTSTEFAAQESSTADPLDTVKAATTLLKSHTTTLSLLLLTPPLTPSVLIGKISDVSSKSLSSMVAAAAYIPPDGAPDMVGKLMRTELRAQVRRLLGTWGDVLALVLDMAKTRQVATGKDNGPTESEKQEVLSATGILWEACDNLIMFCDNGVVGLVVRRAEELRAVLLDAIEELKEWGEDIVDDGDDAEGSDDEDDIFGASNKLGKDDKELKELLDTGLKKLKMIGMLYQALIKRRLKTYPASVPAVLNSSNQNNDTTSSPGRILDELMVLLKDIPESVDDLASAFYDLDHDEAKETLAACTTKAKQAAQAVQKSWAGGDDEFTAWSAKWMAAIDAA